MSRKAKRYTALGVIIAIIVALLVWYLNTHSIPIFEPGGVVARKEKSLILFALLLAVIVVVPTFALTIWIAVRYNEKNATTKTKYSPDFDHSRLFESIYWGIPIVIIGILSYVAWNSAHTLSPYKSLVSDKQPLTIQVVSLDWKWLFIYPEQGVASVNEAAIPVNTPVDFEVTSDTIMNSFWVPALGGQIYSMPGMITQINEMADRTGNFAGSPANIAGEGFSRMDFTIKSMNSGDFSNWVFKAKTVGQPLNSKSYATLAKPSMNTPVSYYSSVPPNFEQDIAMKYMMPMSKSPSSSTMDSNSNNSSKAMSMPMSAMRGMK